MTEKTRGKLLRILIFIFCIFFFIFLIIQFYKGSIKKDLLSTETYEIYELTPDDDYIYFSYVDKDNKIYKDYEGAYEIKKILYMDEKNQVTIEKWGRNKKVKKVKLIKFHLDEKTYKELSEKYEWNYNME